MRPVSRIDSLRQRHLRVDPRKKFRILGLLKRLNQERGSVGENEVACALEELKGEGEIAVYYQSERNDHEGVDFVVIRSRGRILIQSKSSFGGAIKHWQHYCSGEHARIIEEERGKVLVARLDQRFWGKMGSLVKSGVLRIPVYKLHLVPDPAGIHVLILRPSEDREALKKKIKEILLKYPTY